MTALVNLFYSEENIKIYFNEIKFRFGQILGNKIQISLIEIKEKFNYLFNSIQLRNDYYNCLEKRIKY
jgi:hypothetical protein